MKIDARGKICPEPVIMTKKALDGVEEGVLTVLVDNFASKENVVRFATNQGHTADVADLDGDFQINIAVGYPCELPETLTPQQSTSTDMDIVLHISSESVGDDETLGKQLMIGFIGNIINMDILPKTIIFVNSGIKLTCENEATIDSLKLLAEKGIEILSCGVCLTHFGLETSLQVGEISDAHRVMTRMFESDKMIKV